MFLSEIAHARVGTYLLFEIGGTPGFLIKAVSIHMHARPHEYASDQEPVLKQSQAAQCATHN